MADTEAILDPVVSCEIFFIIIYLGVFLSIFLSVNFFIDFFYFYFCFAVDYIVCVCSLNKYFVIFCLFVSVFIFTNNSLG